MDPTLIQLLTETLPGPAVALVALVLALKGRNGKGRHTVEATVQDILAARQQAQETTDFRAQMLRAKTEQDEVLRTLMAQLHEVRQHIQTHDFAVYQSTLRHVMASLDTIRSEVTAIRESKGHVA